MIEALVGLVIIALAMLFTMALLAQQPGLERRLAAHREALRLMESELETMRADLVVPSAGELDLSDTPRASPPAAGQLRIWLEVDPQPSRFLYRVKLVARYAAGGRRYERTLESMIWTPP